MSFNEMKKAFRRTKAWKDFTKELRAERKVDALTHSKLRKGSLSHHMDLNPDNYTVLDKDKFECLNIKSHDVIHFLYSYYAKDRSIMTRLQNILDRMIELNEDKKNG